jgi:large subunit ribosomal protein L7Ae
MYQRLKVPPTIAHFSRTLDQGQASALFKLLLKYRPEDKATKKERLLKEAGALLGNNEVQKKRPIVVKFGINHVTQLVEAKKAHLVIIAHDVDPIEIVCWLPTLCKTMGVPYVIVRCKARLGQVVHRKTAAVLALVGVKTEDTRELSKFLDISRDLFIGGPITQWGGGHLGPKAKLRKKKQKN